MSRSFFLLLPASSKASLGRAVVAVGGRCRQPRKSALGVARYEADESSPRTGEGRRRGRVGAESLPPESKKRSVSWSFAAGRDVFATGYDPCDRRATCCPSGASGATQRGQQRQLQRRRGYSLRESSSDLPLPMPLPLPLPLVASIPPLLLSTSWRQVQQQQQHDHHHNHHRHFHNSTYASRQRGEYYKLRNHKKAAGTCPFKVLGLDRSGTTKKKGGMTRDGAEDNADKGSNEDADDGTVLTYRAVKTAFLKIAMAHHPDTTEAETQEEMDAHRDIFIRAREAFEMIVPGPNGAAILRSESPEHAEQEEDDDDASAFDMDAWFQSETGLAMPFMDLQTMKEVAKMTETVGHGLDRDGGMWLLAEMVSDNVKKGGGDGMSLLRLEAGDVAHKSHVDGVLRRRRRRDR